MNKVFNRTLSFLEFGVFFDWVNDMADWNKLEKLLKRLLDELKDEVLQFAESLLDRSDSSSSGNGTPQVCSFFGIWDSGDSRSANNDRIDADLAREYATS